MTSSSRFGDKVPLVRTVVRLSKRGPKGSPVFEIGPAYVPHGQTPFIGAMRGPDAGSWSVVHLPTGMVIGGLHASTLRGLAPIVVALNACTVLDAPPAERPGQGISGARWRLSEVREVINASDTSSLDPVSLLKVWNLKPSAAAPAPAKDAPPR